MNRSLVLFLLLTGCAGSTAERICNKAVRCAERSDDPEEIPQEVIDECIELYDESEQLYEEAGCGEAYDAFMTCALKNAECNTDDGELTGIYDVCDPELRTLGDCIGTPE